MPDFQHNITRYRPKPWIRANPDLTFNTPIISFAIYPNPVHSARQRFSSTVIAVWFHIRIPAVFFPYILPS